MAADLCWGLKQQQTHRFQPLLAALCIRFCGRTNSQSDILPRTLRFDVVEQLRRRLYWYTLVYSWEPNEAIRKNVRVCSPYECEVWAMLEYNLPCRCRFAKQWPFHWVETRWPSFVSIRALRERTAGSQEMRERKRAHLNECVCVFLSEQLLQQSNLYWVTFENSWLSITAWLKYHFILVLDVVYILLVSFDEGGSKAGTHLER